MRLCSLLLAWACVAAPGTSLAARGSDDVVRYLIAAARLYENLEYERALEQLQRARQLSRGVEDDVTIALYEGVILADLGKREESRAAFKTALFLKPDAKLPVKVSPKVERDFEQVRVEVKAELAPILARREAEAKAASLALTPKETPKEKEAFAVQEAPAVEAKTPVLPFVFGGLAVAAGGAGGYFGLQSRGQVQSAREATFLDDREAHLRAATGTATVANILFATAGAAAVGALVTWATSGPEEAPAP